MNEHTPESHLAAAKLLQQLRKLNDREAVKHERLSHRTRIERGKLKSEADPAVRAIAGIEDGDEDVAAWEAENGED